jgi:hypothetical protein
MKKGIIWFHQGWTDIVCQLPLINWYLQFYDHLKVIIRDDARNFVDFYVKDLENVEVVYIPTDNGRHLNTNHLNIDTNYDILFHGEHDVYRRDNYRYSYFRGNEQYFFIESFYACYNIPYTTRVDLFSFNRDIDLEERVYNDFINKYGDKYVLYHDDQFNSNYTHIPTKIDFGNKLDDHNYVNLNKISNNFFDFIKIIQNAKEVHLIDSIWGSLYYQIDSKYGLFSDKKINLHAMRGYKQMFENPVKLKNWNII